MTLSLRPLAWSRIGLAAVALIRTTPLVHAFDPTLGAEAIPLMGWPRAGVLASPAPGFGLSADTVKALCVARTIALALFLVGWRPRLSGVAAAVTGYLVVLQNAFAFTFTQHLLFVGVFVLALTDCATELAVRPEPARSPRTSRWLVWAFTTSIYAWAGVAKLRRDWFDGRTLGLFFDEGKLRGPLAALLAGTPERRALSGPLVVALELSLMPLLLMPKTRLPALVAAFGFHLTL